MTKSRETEYVRQLLQMNPLEQSTEIIAKRRDFLLPQDRVSHIVNEHDSFDERKEQVIKNINALRKCLWSLDSKALSQQIEAINVSEFPDLVISVTRLKAIADCRDSFRRLQKHPDCVTQFFNLFCDLVVASPQKASRLRADYFNVARKRVIEPRFRILKEHRRIALIIQREFPELYMLEKPWFNQILANQYSRYGFKLVDVFLAILALLVMLCFYFIAK